MSDFLRPHELEHTRFLCFPPSPRVCSNSYSLSQWYYLTISSSNIPFSFCLQSFSASGSFPMGCLFASKYCSFSFSISTSSDYSGLISFGIDWSDLLAVQETHRSLSQCHNLKASILWHSVFFMDQLSHLYMTTEKTIALTVWTFVSKVISLLFNTLSKFVSFPSQVQASFNFMAAVTVCSDFGAQENKICHCF